MIDVTTKAGMDRILELSDTMTIKQIIERHDLRMTPCALDRRVQRYRANGIPTYRRHSLLDRDILVTLAEKGCYQAEAARLINSTPLQVSRCAKKFGIVFMDGVTSDGRDRKPRAAKVEPTSAETMPLEIRGLLAGRWANAQQPGIFLVGR